MRKILSILITVNVIGLFLFAALWVNAAWLAPMDTAGRVTALDRAEVFNEAKLKAFRPDLAANLRYNVAAWLVERERQASVFTAICGLAVCAGNLAVIMIGSMWAECDELDELPSEIVSVNPPVV